MQDFQSLVGFVRVRFTSQKSDGLKLIALFTITLYLCAYKHNGVIAVGCQKFAEHIIFVCVAVMLKSSVYKMKRNRRVCSMQKV